MKKQLKSILNAVPALYSSKVLLLTVGLLLFTNSLLFAQHGHHQHHHHTSSNDHTHHSVDYSIILDNQSYVPPEADDEGYYWWKGNLHTHTLWSDGDQFPEVVAHWYYEHGYHFLALSDHNILSRGQKWINLENRVDEYNIYRQRFGDNWIETRDKEGIVEVRLKPLNEVRSLFEQAGRFIMIESEEITERTHTIHVNATNIHDLIEPQAGNTVEETIRLNINAVVEQREQTGQEMISHLNHPNFRNAVRAEDMAPVENMRLFEIYNGHRGVINFGDEDGTKSLNRMWDIVLSKRLGELNLDPVFGVAVDDAHNYENSASQVSRPGRGWINVRTRFLTPEHIVRALEGGDFYASSGVTIAKVNSDGQNYSVSIEPEDDIEYTILFIGTREGYDTSSQPYIDPEGNTRNDRTRIYSNDIGQVLKEIKGTEGSYTFEGDELYVRAKVISTKLKDNYFMEGEVEKAWLQPLQPGHIY